MTNEEAIEYLKLFHGYDLPIQEALEMAIEALENNDKLAEDLQNCLEMYKKKKAEVESLTERKNLIAKLKHLEMFNEAIPKWVYKVIEGAK